MSERTDWQDADGNWHYPDCGACRPEGCCCFCDVAPRPDSTTVPAHYPRQGRQEVATVKRWLWLRFTREGRDEREGAKRYQAMLDAGRPAMLAAAARTKACSPHPNRESSGVTPNGWLTERCLDCGTGFITVKR